MIMRLPTAALLADKTFFIEFQGYLSNHAKHAIVALEGLNAPDTKVQDYWNEYTTMTPYNLELKPAEPWKSIQPIESMDQWKALKGKKEQWQEMCVFLEEQRRVKSTEQLVKELAPDLLGGIGGALMHGIIHLGWGIDGNSDWMTLEGLAYLNFCHVGVDFAKLETDAIREDTPMESLLRVAKEFQEKNLAETWIADTKSELDDKENFHPELVVAGFQWELAKVFSDPHAVATSLPTWLTQLPIEEVWKQLYETCALLFLATLDEEGNGNFLVLHLLSSLWALEHVCKVVDDTETTRKAFKEYYAVMIVVLSSAAGGFPSAEKLQAAHEEFPVSKRDAEFDWSPVVARAFTEQEEHNIKLPYVCKELWNRFDHWHGFSQAATHFTVTPNIGPKKIAYKAD